MKSIEFHSVSEIEYMPNMKGLIEILQNNLVVSHQKLGTSLLNNSFLGQLCQKLRAIKVRRLITFELVDLGKIYVPKNPFNLLLEIKIETEGILAMEGSRKVFA